MRRRIPTVNVAVAMTVPTIQRMSLVSRLAISVRTPAISVRCSAICVESRVSRFAISVRTSARPALNWFGGDVVALLEAVVDRLGDDFGLVAGDAASGELLGDGEGVEHAVSVARAGRGRGLESWGRSVRAYAAIGRYA